jgi:O-antigen ligase
MPNYIRVLTYLSIFLLPLAANLLEHGGSVLYSLLALFGILFWISRRRRPVFENEEKLLMAAFAGFFLVCFISFLLRGLFSSQAGFDWNLDHEIRFLGLLPIYYLLRFQTGLRQWPVWYGAATGAVASAAYALWHAWMVQNGIRVFGPYNAIAFGDLSLIYGFVGLAGIRWFARQHPLLVILPLAGFVSGLLAAFLSGTLGAVLAIPLLSLFFLVHLGEFPRPWIYRAAGVLLICIAVAGYYQMSSAPIQKRLHSELKQARLFFSGHHRLTGEDAYRLRVWSAAWQIYKDHPLVGVGKEGYRREIREKSGIEAPHLHNMYLEFMLNYGLFGILLIPVLLLPLGLFLKAAAECRTRSGKDLAYAGLSLTGGYIIFAVTECIFYRNALISVYLVLTAGLLVLIRQKEEEAEDFDQGGLP